MTTARQLGFSFGQVGKALYARVDQNFYALGLRTLRNAFIERAGPATSRSGTVHCNETHDSTNLSKIFSFIFSPDPTQVYAIEFGNFTARFYKNRQLVTETAKTISAATKASPCQLTVTAHGWATGDHVVIASGSVVGMRELNRRQYIVTVINANTVTLQRLDGTNIDSTTYGTYVSGGSIARVYKIVSPYASADLSRLYFSESADVVSIAHPKYPLYELSRLGDANWTLLPAVLTPDVPGPSGITISSPSTNPGNTLYQVTSISAATGQESLPGQGSPISIDAYALAASGSVVTIKKTAHGLSTGTSVQLAASNPLQSITGIQCAGAGQNVVFTVTAHGLTNGDTLRPAAIPPGITSLMNVNPNGGDWVIANVTANTFTLVGVTGNSNFFTLAGTYGNISQPYLATYAGQTWVITVTDVDHFTLNGAVTALTLSVSANTNSTYQTNSTTANNSGAPTTLKPNILTWTVVPGALQYKVYIILNGLSSFIGTTSTPTFKDDGTTIDTSKNPPVQTQSFSGAGNYPGVVSRYQLRLLLGRTDNDPEGLDTSRSGAFDLFTKYIPGRDDDAIHIDVRGNQVNEIRHLIDLQKLVILTSGSEMVANGDPGGTLTPTSVNLRTFSYNGASYVRPVIVDNVLIFIQRSGAQLLGLTFDEFGRHQMFELSLPSKDIFEGHQIVDMAYQQLPDSVIWLLRDDGKLVSFTFVPQETIKGFAVHDTDGFVESICCIPETNQTALYMIVRRDLPNYPSRRYVEVLEQRLITTLTDFVGMDASHKYDGRFRDGTIQVKLTGGSTWQAGESMTAHASVSVFPADVVGSSVVLYGTAAVNGIDQVIRCKITAYSSGTDVTVTPDVDVPAGCRNVYFTPWDLAAIKVFELWQLEGLNVSVLKDGDVYASPNNANVETVATVTNGSLTLSDPGGVVTAGLPFLPDVETLNQDTVQGPPMMGRKKRLQTFNVFVKETRGIWAGPNPPTDDTVDPLEGLSDTAESDVDDPVNTELPLITDVLKFRIEPRWNNNGRVFLRQVDPLPMSILSIAPAGELPSH